MAIAIMGFVFPHTMQSLLEERLSDKIIHMYREDADLQNFIDFAQQEVLFMLLPTFYPYLCYLNMLITVFYLSLQFRCCGLSAEGYMDWSKNEYFNCSSPSVERCGVPFSCCMNATDISVSKFASTAQLTSLKTKTHQMSY